jgi:hypothetical protein
MISVHPNFIEIIKEPMIENQFLNFVPRNIIIKNMFSKTARESGCMIEELDSKEDKT